MAGPVGQRRATTMACFCDAAGHLPDQCHSHARQRCFSDRDGSSFACRPYRALFSYSGTSPDSPLVFQQGQNKVNGSI